MNFIKRPHPLYSEIERLLKLRNLEAAARIINEECEGVTCEAQRKGQGHSDAPAGLFIRRNLQEPYTGYNEAVLESWAKPTPWNTVCFSNSSLLVYQFLTGRWGRNTLESLITKLPDWAEIKNTEISPKVQKSIQLRYYHRIDQAHGCNLELDYLNYFCENHRINPEDFYNALGVWPELSQKEGAKPLYFDRAFDDSRTRDVIQKLRNSSVYR